MAKDFLWLHELDKEDIDLVGRDASYLGELFKIGVNSPEGFVVASNAFSSFLKQNGLDKKIEELLVKLDTKKPDLVDEAIELIQKSIRGTPLSKTLDSELTSGYKHLFRNSPFLVAFGSFSPNQELPVKKQIFFISEEKQVSTSLKEIWVNLFNRDSIIKLKEIDPHLKYFSYSVIFQNMIAADVSGVARTKEKNTILIKAVWGLLKEDVSQADTYSLDKSDLSIKDKKIEEQDLQTVKVRSSTKEIPIPELFRATQKLDDTKIQKVASVVKKIENHFLFPQEIEWAFEDEKLFILQSLPLEEVETVEMKVDPSGLRLPLLAQGSSINSGIATGPVKIVTSTKQARKVKRGDILSITSFSKNYLPLLKKSSALIVNRVLEPATQNLLHDLGKPTVYAAKVKFSEGDIVTVNGRTGKIFRGGPKTQVVELPVSNTPEKNKELKYVTKVLASFSEGSLAEEVAKKTPDGIGLVKGEHLILEIGQHPRKIIKSKKQKSFADELSKKIASFTKALPDKVVIYRLSNLLTTDYLLLDGGKEYEAKENNPLLGFHGAARFVAEPEVLKLELEAIKTVRNQLGGRNLWLAVPFVRTTEELTEIKKIIAAAGLHRSASLKIFLNLDLPINLLEIEKFISEGIDGINIEVANLVQLLTASDPGNSRLRQYENSLETLGPYIQTARRSGILVNTVLAQLKEEAVDKLVSFGISSLSVPADSIDKAKEMVASAETKLVGKVNS